MFVKINRETHYLWRAVDHEREVMEAFNSKRRNRKAAYAFLKKIMKWMAVQAQSSQKDYGHIVLP